MSVRITLNIEAGNPAELRAAIAELALSYEGADEGEAQETGETTAPQKNRGGRPKKNAAAPPPATGGTGATPETPPPGGSADGQGAGAPASDPAPNLIDTPAADTGVTRDQIVSALQAAMQASSPLGVQQKLVAEGVGESLSKMAAADYPKILGILNGIVAEAATK